MLIVHRVGCPWGSVTIVRKLLAAWVAVSSFSSFHPVTFFYKEEFSRGWFCVGFLDSCCYVFLWFLVGAQITVVSVWFRPSVTSRLTPSPLLLPSAGRRGGPAMHRYHPQGTTETVFGRRRVWQPTLFLGVHFEFQGGIMPFEAPPILGFY